MSNTIVETFKFKKRIPLITIEATIVKQNEQTLLKLNKIFYKSYRNRVISIKDKDIPKNGKDITSDILKNEDLKVIPEEDFILLSENNMNETEYDKKTKDANSKYNNFAILSVLKNCKIYSLGTQPAYDENALDSYNSVYNEWIDTNTKFVKALQTDIESETKRIQNELQTANKELSLIDQNKPGLRSYIVRTNEKDEDDEYTVTPDEVENAKQKLNSLDENQKSISEKISYFENYLTYLQSDSYKQSNIEQLKTAQGFLDKVKNPDEDVILINCIYLENMQTDKGKIPVLYFIDINGKLLFSKDGLTPINKDNETFQLKQKLKNIKIDKDSINKIIQFYNIKKGALPTETKPASSEGKSPFFQFTDNLFKWVSSGSESKESKETNVVKGGRRPQYSRKQRKYKRRKYSVKTRF